MAAFGQNSTKESNTVDPEDVPKATKLYTDIANQVATVTDFLQSILKKVKNGEVETRKGISFLEIKHQLLLSYLTNLAYLMLRKSEGKKLQGDEAIDRLVEIRTVLEKMRPIDQKLRYQVDKLIKTATMGEIAPNDPRRFKPNPDNLVSKLQTADSEGGDDNDDEDEKTPEVQKYVPPKVAAMHFDGDLTVKERKEMQLEKAKRRALSSSLIRELRDQYNEGPEEISERENSAARKAHDAAKHQQEFEEGNFIRLPVTRKEKKLSRKRERMTGLEGLTRFDNISALSHNLGDDDEFEPQSKKKKLSSKLRKGGKKKLAKRRKKFHKK